MGGFRVWAPKVDRVDLVVGDGRVAMERAAGGWWKATLGDAGPDGPGQSGSHGPGTRYGFSLDGGPPRPDPRSQSQPDGVHGLSEAVDHAAFDWHDQRWRGLSLAGAVLYELHVGTFTPEGTFDAAIDRLGHLADLGVDAIELLPVAEFSGRRGWGYDGVDLFAPHHAYGGPDGLKRLVDACHQAGIGVVMDVVYNHLGPAGNYLPEYGPYFSERHHTNWGPAMNFDGPDSGEVRRFAIDNARMWLDDYHCDGLRLDAVHAIIDESAVHILEEMAIEVAALAGHVRRPLFLIAESDLNDPVFVRSRDVGGHGLHASWADEWHHALHAVLTGETNGYYEDFGSLELLAKALKQAWVYDGTWSPHRRRVHGRPPTGLSGRQFVVCTQNHDQVGNRALGERSAALTSEGRLRIAAALLLTAPFTPMFFQGEEWGASTPFQYFTDHEDPELGRAVSVGRRNEFAFFGWRADDVPDPQDPATFERSKLDWAEVQKPRPSGLLDWYRRLVALRRAEPALTDDRLDRVEVEHDEAAATLLVRRASVTVAANLGAQPWTVHAVSSDSVLAASDARITVGEGRLSLPPDTVAIILGRA